LQLGLVRFLVPGIWGALAALLLGAPCVALAQTPREWDYYKSKFVQQDGRVIDFINKQMSHSEGQAFTMYLALVYGDREFFDTVWTWTRNNLLSAGRDGLAAWSWGRREDGSWGVLDANNASDADIFLAWTLLRAGERWKNREYQDAARAMAAAIQKNLTVEEGGRLILLPGREGFVKPGEVAFNPSYFVFPAFHDLARTGDVGDAAFWRRLHASCRELLQKSLSGELKLPPDWVAQTNGSLAPWGEKGRYFSYDAIRVPLYLSWDLDRAALAGFEGLTGLFRKSGTLPARIAVVPGAPDEGQAPAGYYAVLARAAETLGDGPTAAALWEKAEAQLANEKEDYYSHVLFLMSKTRGLQ
jgi:endoglucanase